jgi:hypothetical protein
MYSITISYRETCFGEEQGGAVMNLGVQYSLLVCSMGRIVEVHAAFQSDAGKLRFTVPGAWVCTLPGCNA